MAHSSYNPTIAITFTITITATNSRCYYDSNYSTDLAIIRLDFIIVKEGEQFYYH